MSCKYCTPINNEVEPLDVSWNLRMTIKQPSHTKRAAIVMTDGEHTIRRYIDYCPICGELLRPFGPAWAHNVDR